MRNWKNAKLPLNIMENCSKGLKYALSGHMEIHPCPTGHWPFRAAALLSLHFFIYHSMQGIGYRWPCAILGWLVLLSSSVLFPLCFLFISVFIDLFIVHCALFSLLLSFICKLFQSLSHSFFTMLSLLCFLFCCLSRLTRSSSVSFWRTASLPTAWSKCIAMLTPPSEPIPWELPNRPRKSR